MADFKRIEQRVSKVQHGFLVMLEVAREIIAEDDSVPRVLRIAKKLYESEKYQVRTVSVFLLGFIASKSQVALGILRKNVSQDISWQVQEILAQAFNEYCRCTGYEKSLPVIREWLGDKNANVRRAVSEGLRIWNRKEYFDEHPEVALQLLSKLKDDESEYVRRSAGNSLRDISRREKELVKAELAKWDKTNPKIAYTFSLASKFL
jgi:3-methyladenine DNA glycosylase AlkC